MTRPRSASVAILALVAVLAAACSPASTATTSPAPPTSAEVAPPTEAELRAIRFRESFALQADLAHVRAVALDPRASTADFSVPLLPEEVELLIDRAADAELPKTVTHAEADAHPEDFCGVYIDHQNGGAVTSMWKAGLESHSAAILRRVGPFAKVAFRPCRFSLGELGALTDSLSGIDHDWMADVPAVATGWGPDVVSNQVEMDVSSAMPDAPERIRRHYEALLAIPPGMFVVRSDGTGVQLVPWGRARVFVTRPDGGPLGANDLAIAWYPGGGWPRLRNPRHGLRRPLGRSAHRDPVPAGSMDLQGHRRRRGLR